MKILKKILNIIINTLIVIVLIASIFVAVSALTSKANGMPSVLGYTFQSIQSDSMKGGSDKFEGGDFEKGDLIISRTTGYEADAEYAVGDIVTYSGRLEGAEEAGDQLICHRIVDTKKSGDTTIYMLKGDNPEAQKIDEIPSSSIAAKFYTDDYKGSVLKGWGGFFDFITSQNGFFFCILLPMIIFFIYAIIRVVLSTINYRKGKEDDAKEDAEKEKQAAVDAAVAAALAEKNSKEDAKPADAPADMTPEQMEQFKQFLAFQKAQQATEAAEAPAEAAAPDEATAENSAETPDNTETTSEE